MPTPETLELPPRQRAADTIRRWIGTGRLPQGERLPGEDRLATEIGVSRFTVHAALDDLAVTGIVQAVGKRGWIVPSSSSAVALRTVLALGSHGRPREWAAAPWSDTAIHLGLIAAAADHGTGVLSYDHERLAGVALDGVLGRRCDAVASLRDPDDRPLFAEALDRAAALGLPTVVATSGEPHPRFDSTGSDHRVGAAMLVGRLAAQGQRRLLVVTEAGAGVWRWQQRRMLGYADGCAAAGLPAPRILPIELPADAAHDVRVRVAESHLRDVWATGDVPDAVCALTDRNAYVCAGALRRLGVADGVRVAGYDGMAAGCPEAEHEGWCTVLSIDKRNGEVGIAALELIQRRWADPAAARSHVAVEPRVVELRPRRAFTLIELLVVVAIIGVLAALLLSGIVLVKDAAKTLKCQSNLRQIHLIMTAYAVDNEGMLPPGCKFTVAGWSVDQAWDRQLWDTGYLEDLRILRCPTDNDARWDTFNPPRPRRSYGVNWNTSNDGTPAVRSNPERGLGLQIGRIMRPSSKVLAVDSRRWYNTHRSHVDVNVLHDGHVFVPGSPVIQPLKLHRGDKSANYLYADGHVKTLPRPPAGQEMANQYRAIFVRITVAGQPVLPDPSRY